MSLWVALTVGNKTTLYAYNAGLFAVDAFAILRHYIYINFLYCPLRTPNVQFQNMHGNNYTEISLMIIFTLAVSQQFTLKVLMSEINSPVFKVPGCCVGVSYGGRSLYYKSIRDVFSPPFCNAESPGSPAAFNLLLLTTLCWLIVSFILRKLMVFRRPNKPF